MIKNTKKEKKRSDIKNICGFSFYRSDLPIPYEKSQIYFFAKNAKVVKTTW